MPEAAVSRDDERLPEKRTTSDIAEARRRRNDSRRSEVMSLLLVGFSQEQIAERLGVSRQDIGYIIERALQDTGSIDVAQMRSIENARLDRAQAAIWSQVLEGDSRAIQTFLQISNRRSRLNGLDAPMQIEISGHVKIEMQQALRELEEIVLGEVITDGGFSETEPEAFE